MLHSVIIAGGGGTRFWPRSRQQRPKQFLNLVGERTLIQQAYDRVEAQVPPERNWVITAGRHQQEAQKQLPAIPANQIIGEPFGRDTAACIGLGAALVAQNDPNAVMLVMPADHVIEPVQQFQRAVHVAEQTALEHPGALITFGITPTFPSTGYGYIHRGDALPDRQGVQAYRVKNFHEKPDIQTAERLVAGGEYFWNAGIFVWKAATLLQALRQFQPELFAAVGRIAEAWNSPDRDHVFQTEYEKITKVSIDYAVMEQAKEVLVVQAPFQWDDVGSWLALERRFPQDADGNTRLAEHCGIQTKNCVIVGDKDRLIATVGVENLLIIQDGDAVLVANRNDEGTIKKLVEELKQKGLQKYL